MTEVSITRQECGKCFDDLWHGAFEKRPFDALCTLLRVDGLQDAGWDPLLESDAAFKDYNWHLKAQSDELSDKSRWRIGLLMYCQACEMSAVHSTLANLLRIQLDQKYHLDPLNSLGRPDKKRRNKWYPATTTTKWKKITDMATTAGNTDLVRLIGSVYNDSVRNAFSHSDYVFGGENFRWTEAGGRSLRHGQMPLEQVSNLITNAFSFFGMFMGMRERWLERLAAQPRYHRWPQFEVMELLKTDGKLDGFRVHFSNGSSARFYRSPAGVDLVNVLFEPDGTINFMCGPLGPRYVVDGREVQFGNRKAVHTFERHK